MWEPRVLVAAAVGSALLGASLVAKLAGGAPQGGPRASAPDAAPPAPRSAREAARDVRLLARAIAAPHHRAAGALGAHRLRDRSELRLFAEGRELESLAVDTEIDFAPSGELRARSESRAGDARELVFAGGAIYTRPGYGPFYRRPPEFPEEARDRADELARAPAAYLAPLLAGAGIAARRETTHDGRRALAIELSTGERGAPIAVDAWGARRAELRRVQGELVLDEETGALLAADVRGEVAFARGGQPLELAISLSREIEKLEAPLADFAPARENVIALGEAPGPVESGSDGARAGEEIRWNEP